MSSLSKSTKLNASSKLIDSFKTNSLLVQKIGLKDLQTHQSDWTSLENIAAFLWCFAKLSTEMCASTYPTISAIYPMYNLLMGHAEKKMNKDKTPNNIALAANAAWNKLYEYYNKASKETHYIATILDPR
ncbi:hypothetical protein RhiirA5_433765 [Rhizophagus irregularis]|uniref:Uncharacterized protein n=1 Tax=Rhizophagus irregularis TaxID=588596 RepID=A0A2N0NR82_9GLOM|nr:hypothetical protein RhiirA5_433765 [Rhizophagus irregularis]